MTSSKSGQGFDQGRVAEGDADPCGMKEKEGAAWRDAYPRGMKAREGAAWRDAYPRGMKARERDDKKKCKGK
jgi:hypothetical protein